MNQYVEYSSFYDDLWSSRRIDLDFIESYLSSDIQNVIELGVGSGRTLSLFHKKGIEKYLGLDISAEMLELSRLKNPNPKFVLLEKDVRKYEFQERFDLVLLSWSLLNYLNLQEVEDLISSVSKIFNKKIIIDVSYAFRKPEGGKNVAVIINKRKTVFFDVELNESNKTYKNIFHINGKDLSINKYYHDHKDLLVIFNKNELKIKDIRIYKKNLSIFVRKRLK